jgi:hypothetical protein
MTSEASMRPGPIRPVPERPVPERPVACSQPPLLDELAGRLTDALNTAGQVTQCYRDEVERELLRLAIAKTTRCLGRPTRVFERPGRFHLLITDWGDRLPYGPCGRVRGVFDR